MPRAWVFALLFDEDGLLAKQFGDLQLLLFDDCNEIIRAVRHLLNVLFVGSGSKADVAELLGELIVGDGFVFNDVCRALEAVGSSSRLFVFLLIIP